MPQCEIDTLEQAKFLDSLRSSGLQDEAAFYSKIRLLKMFGPTFDQSELYGCKAVLKACADAKWPISWTAYALATAYHETAHTMQPIKEYGGTAYFTKMYDITGSRPKLAKEMGNTTPGDGPKYCGRGYVQLTWKSNYKKASDKLGVDLVRNPDKAMECDIASSVMIFGMGEGWFTGKSCKTYLPLAGLASKKQFEDARRIINGTDKKTLIAEYAINFQSALSLGKWK